MITHTQTLWECIYVIWEGYEITNMHYGETGFDGWGDVEKGQYKKDLTKSCHSFYLAEFFNYLHLLGAFVCT